jgi:hypothetical protein
MDKDIKTVYILDPNPMEPMYQWNPLAKYVHRLLWIAEHLPKAMSKHVLVLLGMRIFSYGNIKSYRIFRVTKGNVS